MYPIELRIASTPHDFKDAKNLFIEYAKSLPISLDFQNFNAELEVLEKTYDKAAGCVILGYLN